MNPVVLGKVIPPFEQFANPKNLTETHKKLLGCPRKLGSMVRINGLFHPKEYPIYKYVN